MIAGPSIRLPGRRKVPLVSMVMVEPNSPAPLLVSWKHYVS